MTVDEAFAIARNRPPDEDEYAAFHQSEAAVAMAIASMEKIADRLLGDPGETMSISEIMGPVMMLMMLAAYTAGLEAGKESQVRMSSK